MQTSSKMAYPMPGGLCWLLRPWPLWLLQLTYLSLSFLSQEFKVNIGTFKASMGHTAAFWPVLIKRLPASMALVTLGHPEMQDCHLV